MKLRKKMRKKKVVRVVVEDWGTKVLVDKDFLVELLGVSLWKD